MNNFEYFRGAVAYMQNHGGIDQLGTDYLVDYTLWHGGRGLMDTNMVQYSNEFYSFSDHEVKMNLLEINESGCSFLVTVKTEQTSVFSQVTVSAKWDQKFGYVMDMYDCMIEYELDANVRGFMASLAKCAVNHFLTKTCRFYDDKPYLDGFCDTPFITLAYNTI